MNPAPAFLVAVLVAEGCRLVTLAAPPPDDFSQWSRVPLPPDPALTAKAAAACGQAPQQELPFLVQDRRTPQSAIVLYGDADEYMLCWSSHAGGNAFGSGGMTAGERPAPLTGRVARTSGAGAISYAQGAVGLPATRVAIASTTARSSRRASSAVAGSPGGPAIR